MAILKWGKPSQFQKAPANTALNATGDVWKDMALPKEGTLQMQSQQGQETTATEEGGDIVDIRYGKDTYTVEWDEFDRDDVSHAFEDVDGVVAAETAIRWLPEDGQLKGVYIPRAKVRCTRSFNTSDGSMRHYQLRALKPTTGLSVQEYQVAGA